MLYSTQSDETLVMLTLAGEQRAYEVLVLRYEKSLIAAANSVLHNINLAEDAAQDAFITAWMKLNLLNEPAKYGVWAKRIAKNCAKNIAVRFQSYLSLDVLENCIPEDDCNTGDPEIACISSYERKQLHESISDLPEKVRKVINLYYFDGLSIPEIADIMSVSAGTIKRQLHDGRKQLRKELSAMNEDINDTLVQRVMKKVEDLKLWKLKNNKNGFETAYKDVLAEVEELPESQKKYHALADVLMQGWWWIPGKKNDALSERICEAAISGKNEEVMAFVMKTELSKISWTGDKIDIILNNHISKLEKGGFIEALGREWSALANCYFRTDKPEKGFEAYEKAISILPPDSMYRFLASSHVDMKRNVIDNYSEKDLNNCAFIALCSELRSVNGRLYHWDFISNDEGELYSISWRSPNLLRAASKCDGLFTVDNLMPGETHTGSDGTTLTFVSDCETVEAECGTFEGCQLWVVETPELTVRTWYKSGIGIVRQQYTECRITDTRTLKAYKIVGGTGLMPIAKGNEWEYVSESNPEALPQSLTFAVCYSDDKKSIISSSFICERIKYDENSWHEMMLQIRNEYWNSNTKKCQDISYPMERAELLAKTPLEKAHTKAACSVARRILSTNSGFNPDCTALGKWNFFEYYKVLSKNENITLQEWYIWNFELKNVDGIQAYPLLYNNIIAILQNNTGYIWSDEWKPGFSVNYDHEMWNYNINTTVTCEAEPLVTTKTETFENCLKLTTESSGFESGLAYIGERKEFYFTAGIGIVKAVNYYADNLLTAVYELTSYEGTGEGYMPIIDGASRRYELINAKDGLVGSTDYTFVFEDGAYHILSDRCGIQTISNYTDYASILGEQIEEKLWEEWKTDESYVQHGINNLNLLTHYLTRFNDRFWNPGRTAAWRKYKVRFLESLGGGEVPKAWLGIYSWWLFCAGGAMIGAGQKEEGYEYIEKAIEVFPEWQKIPEGELLELGEEFIFCGVKAVKNKPYVLLPDGTKAVHNNEWIFESNICNIYAAMTTTTDWGWLDSARNEERFKKDVEKAKALLK